MAGTAQGKARRGPAVLVVLMRGSFDPANTVDHIVPIVERPAFGWSGAISVPAANRATTHTPRVRSPAGHRGMRGKPRTGTRPVDRKDRSPKQTMGFWSRVADFARQRDGDPARYEGIGPDTLWGEWGEGGGTASGVPVTTTSAMRHVAVMACVSILASDVAKIPLDVFRRLSNGGKEVLTDHYLHRLLRAPNDWQDGFEFKEMLQASLVLRGNGYAVAVRNGRGVPLYMVPIHPDRVGLFEAPTGEYFYFVTRNGLHEMAMLRDKPLMIPSYDMLHLRWMPMWNSLLGTSRLGMVRQSIGVSIGLEEHQARFIGQGARTGGVLSTDQKFANKEIREQLREEWQRLQAGPKNSGATAILEQGLKWQPLGLSMVDAQFINSRKFQLRDVARAFDVPPYKLAIEGESEGPAMVQMGQQYLERPDQQLLRAVEGQG